MGDKARRKVRRSKTPVDDGHRAIAEKGTSPTARKSPRLAQIEDALVCANIQFQHSITFRSFVADIAEQHFVAHFVLAHQIGLTSWPSILQQLSQSPVLKPAVRAGTLAFYGKLKGDVAIQTEASHWYSTAIENQIARIIRGDKVENSDVASATAILAPIMLSTYESALCTSPMGWAHHLGAAGKMLEMLGPESCQTGYTHQLFKMLRLSMVSAQSPYASVSSPSHTSRCIYRSPWTGLLRSHRRNGVRSRSKCIRNRLSTVWLLFSSICPGISPCAIA